MHFETAPTLLFEKLKFSSFTPDLDLFKIICSDFFKIFGLKVYSDIRFLSSSLTINCLFISVRSPLAISISSYLTLGSLFYVEVILGRKVRCSSSFITFTCLYFSRVNSFCLFFFKPTFRSKLNFYCKSKRNMLHRYLSPTLSQ